MIKPILFNTEMIQAILAGRKTVTRRVIKPHNPVKAAGEQYRQGVGLWIDPTTDNADNDGHIKDYSISPCWSTFKWYLDKYAPYHIGDILYVRETWAKVKGESRYLYKADKVDFIYKELHSSWKWKPSIHMPKEAARIFLRVTNVSAARLHDITEEDAYREGVMKAHDPTFNVDYWYYKSDQNYMNDKCWTESARQCFLWGLWNGTLKSSKEYEAYNNNRNPWVWVIEFERTEKPNGI